MTVNGPAGMYQIKPFYESFREISLPNCMYKMKNLHASPKKESNDPYQVLATRQEIIINRLEELKSQVLKIKNELVPESQSQVDSKTETKSLKSQPIILNLNEKSTDIVINASPINPPLSLWVLRNLLRESGLKISLISHVHSSVTNVPDNIKKLAYDSAENRLQNHANFTLIWKNVGSDPELMVKPLLQHTIQGEANVVRFIARTLLPTTYYEESNPDIATEIDCWLDKSYFSLSQGNNKERQSFLRQMNGHLGKKEYLVGDNVTIADIVIWSSIAQTQMEKSLPSNVGNWWKRLSSMSAFSNIL